MSRLKPCQTNDPMCSPRIESTEGMGASLHYVECCCGRSGPRGSKEYAITQWNTRAEPAPPVLDWPEKPSEEVLNAGAESAVLCSKKINGWKDDAREIYNAMRKAHAKTKQPPKGDA